MILYYVINKLKDYYIHELILCTQHTYYLYSICISYIFLFVPLELPLFLPIFVPLKPPLFLIDRLWLLSKFQVFEIFS